MKIKMISNGKKNVKTWKTVAHCRDCKTDKCSCFLQGWYMYQLICRSKNFSLVKLSVHCMCAHLSAKIDFLAQKELFQLKFIHNQSSERSLHAFSGLEGYHSVDSIYKVGSIPVYSSEIIHIWRIVHFDFMTKSSIF